MASGTEELHADRFRTDQHRVETPGLTMERNCVEKHPIVFSLMWSLMLESVAYGLAWLSLDIPYLWLLLPFLSVSCKIVICLWRHCTNPSALLTQLLFVSYVLPWIVIIPFITTIFAQECEHVFTETVFHTASAVIHDTVAHHPDIMDIDKTGIIDFMNETIPNLPRTTYEHYAVQCPRANWTAGVAHLPIVLESGIPGLILYLAFNVDWGIDLTSRFTRRPLRRLIVDFADVIFFSTIPYAKTGVVFFKDNPIWFKVTMGIYVVAFVMTLFRAFLLANFPHLFGVPVEASDMVPETSTPPDAGAWDDEATDAEVQLGPFSNSKDERKRKSSRWVPAASLCFSSVTVSLRLYFYFAGLTVSIVFLFKGVACTVHELCWLWTNDRYNDVSTRIDDVVEMLPGMAKLDKKADQELLEKTFHVLRKIRKVCLQEESLTSDEINHIFHFFDFDKNERLSAGEFKLFVQMLLPDREERANEIFYAADINHDQSLQIDEFRKVLQDIQKTERWSININM